MRPLGFAREGAFAKEREGYSFRRLVLPVVDDAAEAAGLVSTHFVRARREGVRTGEAEQGLRRR